MTSAAKQQHLFFVIMYRVLTNVLRSYNFKVDTPTFVSIKPQFLKQFTIHGPYIMLLVHGAYIWNAILNQCTHICQVHHLSIVNTCVDLRLQSCMLCDCSTRVPTHITHTRARTHAHKHTHAYTCTFARVRTHPYKQAGQTDTRSPT